MALYTNRKWRTCQECGQKYFGDPTYAPICKPCFERIGAKRQDSGGYIWTRLAEDDLYYPMTRNWWRYGYGWVQEHRYIMAQHLGRCLEDYERVYHKNSKRDDNRLQNLTMEMPKAHRLKAFKAIRRERARQK